MYQSKKVIPLKFVLDALGCLVKTSSKDSLEWRNEVFGHIFTSGDFPTWKNYNRMCEFLQL